VITSSAEGIFPTQTVQFQAAVTDRDGRVLNGVPVTWTTDAPQALQIDPSTGEAIGLSVGSVGVTATAGGVSERIVFVVHSRLAALSIGPPAHPLATAVGVGRSVALEPRADVAPGAPAEGIEFEWLSSDASVASVNSEGVVTGRAPGTAVITLRSEAKEASMPVQVERGFTVTELGGLGGTSSDQGVMYTTRVTGLNNQGWAVGYAVRPDGTWSAMLWRDGQALDLGFATAQAFGVSDAGHVVGATLGRGFLWQDGKVTMLAPGSSHSDRPVAVNRQGMVVGNGSEGTNQYRLLSWNADGSLRTLAGLDGFGEAHAVNDAGDVAGQYRFGEEWAGFVWRTGAVERLPMMAATALNDRGDLAGWRHGEGVVLVGGVPHTVAADRLGGYVMGGMNSSTVVVGHYQYLGTPRSAFVWRGDAVLDLTGLVTEGNWEIRRAVAVNDQGWIAADAVDVATRRQASLLLTPVP
jgi:hypothetical protein